MKLFIDSADPSEIKEALSWGYADGVTTNPSLAAKVGRPYSEIVQEILSLVTGDVSLETIATNAETIINEAYSLCELGEQVVVKIPCTSDGYKAASTLSDEGIRINMTLCFSVNQALLAAKVGAKYVSPFIGRIDDISDHGGDNLIADIRTVYDNYGFKTQILAASVRDKEHVARAALLGADAATVPFNVLKALHHHKLTDSGLEKFLDDWQTSGLELPTTPVLPTTSQK